MVDDPNRPTGDGFAEDELTESDRAPNDEQIQAILERRRQAQSSRVPRPTLSPGFDAYTHRPDSRRNYIPTRTGVESAGRPREVPTADVSTKPITRKRGWGLGWLMPWRAKSTASPALTSPAPKAGLTPAPLTQPGTDSATSEWPYPTYPGVEGGLIETPGTRPVDQPQRQRLWDRQPYSAIAHVLLTSGVLTTAWLLGILVAQILPGRFERPPFQESVLRKSSRLTYRLWHFSSLWDTPTTYRRIEAIPLPETGPVSGPIELSPIEKQPLVDELNAIETEVVTLERRLASLEKRLGKSPYQGTGIDSRIGTLRTAIDPPVREEETAEPYEPVASEPNSALLEVAKLSVVLPADALFAPGDSQLKEAELLQQVLDQLVGYPEATISVRSHSDDQASVTDSQEYTLAQAIALTSYLRRTLPTEHRWISVGLGQSQPVNDNSDVIYRQRNRRIEILVDTR